MQMNAHQISAARKDHLFLAEAGGSWQGHALSRLLRALKRSGFRFGPRCRVPFTDAMCLPYHGGWICFRYIYFPTPRGLELRGTLYDKMPPPPLTLGQRQRLERLRKELTFL